MITEHDLAVGFEHDGQVLKRFVMRAATIADSIAAVSKAPTVDDKDFVGAAVHNDLTVRIFKAAEQLQFVDAPELAVTGEMLLDLADEDADVIIAAQDDVAKKRKAALSGLSPTTTSLPASDS
ncbi:MAG: hypothetical protein K9L79_00360 [Methylobacter tundripaludum]|nr:hypothetical protein [Methylobacter tundripaludum]